MLALAPLGVDRRRGPRPDLPRARPRDPARRRRRGRTAGRPRRPAARARARRRRRPPRRAGRGDLAAQGRARRDAGGRRRGPGRRADRATRSSTTSAVARGRGRARLRRPRARRDRAARGATRPCSRAGAGAAPHLLVDEVQDVDRAQLRLALLLAAPANRILLVGDDDQSIYGWRLADVRRILGLDALPAGPAAGRPRGQLPLSRDRSSSGPSGSSSTTASGSRRAIRAGPAADGPARPRARRVRRDASGSSAVMRSWPDDGSTRRSSPARTASCSRRSWSRCDLGLPFRAPRIDLPLEDPASTTLLGRAPSGRVRGRATAPRRARRASATAPRARLTATSRSRPRCWLGGRLPHLDAFRDADRWTARRRLADLRRDDAPLTLATAHATKGLEFDHVVVVGMEVGRFPSARAVSRGRRSRAAPTRRSGASRYVAWTRARRSLTLLYDPAVPSPFLLEAFTATELGITEDRRAGS